MKISIDLFKDDLQSVIRQLEEYKVKLKSKTERLAERLAEEGFKIMTANLNNAKIGLSGSDRLYVEQIDKNKFVIGVESEKILFLEFGTGIKYSSIRHPKADELGYGAGTFPGKGYWNDPAGWWYMGKDGEFHHTFGVAPRRPMYDTAKELREKINDVIKEVFGSG